MGDILRILIDGKSLQARHHRRDDQRLCTLLSALRQRHQVDLSSEARTISDYLPQYDAVIVATRYPEAYRYAAEELQAIHRFVYEGGGLLLLTNHADLPGRNPNDTREYDAELAATFGIDIQPTFFRNHLENVPTVLAGETLRVHHPIIKGASNEERIRSIVTNTCSSIRCERGESLALLPPKMVDRRTGESAQTDQVFAHAFDLSLIASSEGTGRIVTIADSGFIGSRWTEVPGPGLITWGDNLQFISNAVQWAGHEG